MIQIKALFLVLLSTAASAATGAAHPLDVNIDTSTGAYDVLVNGDQWLSSGPTFFTVAGTVYSTEDSSLILKSHTPTHGTDPQLGAFDGSTFTWAAGDVPVETEIRRHATERAVVFVQHFPQGIPNTGMAAADENKLLTAFPSLLMQPKPHNSADLGYLSFSGRFLEASKAGAWSSNGGGFPGDVKGTGPFAVFDQTLKTAVMVSPFDTFVASSVTALKTKNGTSTVGLGLLGSLSSVPAGFTVRFIVRLGSGSGQGVGVAGAVKEWGSLLLSAYGKDAAKTRALDWTLSHLGYSTDNGAFYYRGPEHGKTYEETMLDVHAYAQDEGIPYSYALLDSWWYYKGQGDGVKNWTARPEIFPHGLGEFHKNTGWKVQGHNRYWSNNTDYARANGGDYDFVVEPENSLAIPVEERFWDDLLSNASQGWGLAVYEQDWMYNEFNGMNVTRENITIGADWLRQMGAGATKAGVAIQYCMTYPRFLLQTVEIPSVTQFRAGDDYGPGQSTGCGFPYCVYDISLTSIISWALGLAPAKDDFWTTPQPGGAYGNHTEPYNGMEATIAAWSTGPVQPSDAINMSNATLIRATCTATTGTLLQPSRPAAAIDACLGRAAFGDTFDGPKSAKPNNPAVWSTHTEVSGFKWPHVLVIGLADPFNLRPAHLPLDLDLDLDLSDQNEDKKGNGDGNGNGFVAWQVNTTDGTRSALAPFTDTKPMALKPCMYYDFATWHASPVLEIGKTSQVVVLGEVGKLVPVSVHRFQAVDVSGTEVTVHLLGDSGEMVSIEYAHQQQAAAAKWGSASVQRVDCTIGAAGKATATISAGGKGACQSS